MKVIIEEGLVTHMTKYIFTWSRLIIHLTNKSKFPSCIIQINPANIETKQLKNLLLRNTNHMLFSTHFTICNYIRPTPIVCFKI